MNQIMKYKIAAGFLLMIISFAVFAWRSGNNDLDFPVLTTQETQQTTQAAASQGETDPASKPQEAEKQEVLVDVSGAVKHPGVVRLMEGSRVFEAVELAGGIIENADLRAINLAAEVRDGQKIYLPITGERTQDQTADTWQIDGNQKLDLNTASASSLQELDGIGEKTAEKIIAYREAHGGFRTVEELMQVSGIGAKTFEGLKEQIAVYE